MGKPLIMGRRTYDSFPRRPLPGRKNIVLTRDPSYRAEGAYVAHSKDQALALAGDAPEIVVFGGAQIFEMFLPMADRLYLTTVDAEVDGDTYFDKGTDDWRVVSNERHEKDERHPYAFNMYVLDRIR